MALRITGLGEEIAAVTGLPWNVSLEEWPEDPLLACLLYTSPSPRDRQKSRMPSSA